MTQKLLYLRLACILPLLFATSLYAAPVADKGAEATPVPAAIAGAITANLKKSRPTLVFESVERTPVPGLYAVKVMNGPTLYVTEDARYFVLGDLYEITDQQYVNLAEKQREVSRAEKLATLKPEDMITFAPQDQPAKATILVFTDVDCFYCQKMHREVPDLNRIGIEVSYLAFPRAGIGSESYRKIVSAWCADDRQTALTKLKNREKIPSKQCPNNPVEAQFKLGHAIGVNGTPALLTPDGKLMPGYIPALQLAAALGVEVDPALAAELRVKQAAVVQ